jgi:hypothetical protein
MTYSTSTVVDFVAKGKTTNVWRIILVEQGPWERNEITAELTRIQNRLYDCVDAAIDGQLARKYPESYGKIIQIEVDGYNLPEHEFSEFFDCFTNNIFQIQDYKLALKESEFISDISFIQNLQKID